MRDGQSKQWNYFQIITKWGELNLTFLKISCKREDSILILKYWGCVKNHEYNIAKFFMWKDPMNLKIFSPLNQIIFILAANLTGGGNFSYLRLRSTCKGDLGTGQRSLESWEECLCQMIGYKSFGDMLLFSQHLGSYLIKVHQQLEENFKYFQFFSTF